MSGFRIPLAKPDIQPQDRDAVAASLTSSYLSRGPMLEGFEGQLAQITGASHAVGVSSGTAALHLSLLALGVGQGDEVITTAFSVPASVNPIIAVGARPRWVDIAPHSRALDPQALDAAFTARTKAVLLVHPFGQAADVQAVARICHRRQVPLIEDACEALGSRIQDQALGRFGRLGCFGFYPNKQITCGEGGAVITDDEGLATAIRQIANNGRAMDGRWLDQDRIGLNYRLAEINAALGTSQLRRLDQIVTKRAAIVKAYRAGLQHLPQLTLPQPAKDEGISWFAFVVELNSPVVARRDGIIKAMAEQGIQLGRYFAPLHRQPALRHLSKAALVHTENLAERVLALPLYHQISPDQIEEVCERLGQLLTS